MRDHSSRPYWKVIQSWMIHEETMTQLFIYEHNARRWELLVRIFYSIAIAIVIIGIWINCRNLNDYPVVRDPIPRQAQ